MWQIFLGIPANIRPPTPTELELNQQIPEIPPYRARSLVVIVVISLMSLAVIVAALPTLMGSAVSLV